MDQYMDGCMDEVAEVVVKNLFLVFSCKPLWYVLD